MLPTIPPNYVLLKNHRQKKATLLSSSSWLMPLRHANVDAKPHNGSNVPAVIFDVLNRLNEGDYNKLRLRYQM